ncbi:hypothetical protein BI335_06510 [Enemella evansiae]|nr:hypothetical protein BI335_06510 [Enemella evansiae]
MRPFACPARAGGTRLDVVTPVAVAGGVLATTVVLGAVIAQSGERGTASDAPAPSPSATRPTTTVTRVIDGDTIQVDDAGTPRRIRLLNVDTPETVDPNQTVQCGGPEATEWLKRRLPAGAEVSLQYDVERTDGYGRTLAKVISRGQNVSAEIAREGLGLAMVIAPNRAFYPEVQAAERQARDGRRGLFAADSRCTVEALVDQQTQALDSATQPPASNADVADYDRQLLLLAAELDRGRALLRDLDFPPDRFPWRGRESSELRGFRSTLQRSQDRAESVHRTWQAERARLAERPTPSATPVPSSTPASTPSRDSGRETTRQPTRTTSTAPRTTKPPEVRPPTTKAPATRAPATKAPTSRAPEPVKPAPQPTSKYTGPRCYEPGGKAWRPC